MRLYRTDKYTVTVPLPAQFLYCYRYRYRLLKIIIDERKMMNFSKMIQKMIIVGAQETMRLLGKLNQYLTLEKIRKIGASIFIFLLTWFFYVQFLQPEFYIWETMDLGGFIDPVQRTTCKLPNISKLGAQSPKKLNVGMLMIYDNADGNWDEHLMRRVIKNRQKYCDMYGIELINGKDQVDKTRPPAWSKLKAMDHYLSQFDYLIYLDMDMVILNDNINILEYIGLDPNKDFMITEDWGGINTGAWITKNTPFSHWFLQTAWNQTQLIPKYSPMGIPYPFEYEQRAFHFLLQTEVWKKRHLQTYRGDSKELWKHFLILPQCSMNSYIVYPFYVKKEIKEKAHYVEGDLLVHFAGKKGKIKTNLINYFLEKAGQ